MMKCPVCGYTASLSRWILVNPVTPQGNRVAPRVNVQVMTNNTQYDKPIYACPQCGVIKIARPTDR